MKLVIGLGNPGPQYRNTRHNAGYNAADRLAQALGTSFSRTMNDALVARAYHAEASVLVIKPQTFMNASGRSVGPITRRYGCLPEDVLVLVDDVYLPLGMLRLRQGGGAAGHKGVLSITAALGSDAFHRLRMGIGTDERPESALTGFVLGRFTATEQAVVEAMTDRAVKACVCWLEEGMVAAMNKFNERGRKKGE